MRHLTRYLSLTTALWLAATPVLAAGTGGTTSNDGRATLNTNRAVDTPTDRLKPDVAPVVVRGNGEPAAAPDSPEKTLDALRKMPKNKAFNTSGGGVANRVAPVVTQSPADAIGRQRSPGSID